jgi:ribonucleoside-diphosphate reductase alpha chain
MVQGKGYFFFPDKVNALNPPMYEEHNLSVKASNLCTEITLHSDADHTFTCVLSSMNLSRYDEWRDTDAVEYATVFLDCVAEEFIQRGREIRGLEKAVRFTERGRALGLGTMGFHTYLQSKGIALDSLEAAGINSQIFKDIRSKADVATKKMAQDLGEPDWCRGFGVRNTHVMAIAPNLSSALVCGGVSQGVEPVYENVYEQATPAGTINRVNPALLKLMRERDVYNDKTLNSILADNGSVYRQDWLSEDEKGVFKTFFEWDQHVLIRLAAQRQRHIDQAQSLNLAFAADADEEYISSVHQEAFTNPFIKSLYYIRSKAGVRGSTGECVACEG